MTFKGIFGRSLAMAGVLTCTAVPLAGGIAYASSPAHHAPAHHAPSAHHRTTTLTTRAPGVHIRSKAKISKRSKIVATLARTGTSVGVRCYKTGTSISGDATWYRTVSPRAGFVAGHELNTGKEPAAGVAPCKVTKKK